jgi:hypothetical protein
MDEKRREFTERVACQTRTRNEEREERDRSSRTSSHARVFYANGLTKNRIKAISST